MFIEDDSPCGYCGQSATKLNWHNFNAKDELKISAEEFIRRIDKMLDGPMRAMREMEGDMYLSDYRTLLEAHHKLTHAVEQLDTACIEKKVTPKKKIKKNS